VTADKEMIDLIKGAAEEEQFYKMSLEDMVKIYNHGSRLILYYPDDDDLIGATEKFKTAIEKKKKEFSGFRCQKCGKPMGSDTVCCPFCQNGFVPEGTAKSIKKHFIHWQKVVLLIVALLIGGTLLVYALNRQSMNLEISKSESNPDLVADPWIVDRVKAEFNKLDAPAMLRALPDDIALFKSDPLKDIHIQGGLGAERLYKSDFAQASLKLRVVQSEGYSFTPHGQISTDLKRFADSRLDNFLKKGGVKAGEGERQMNLANGNVFKYLYVNMATHGIKNVNKREFNVFSIKGVFTGELELIGHGEMKNEHIQAADRFVQGIIERLANSDDGGELFLSVAKARKELISIVRDKKQEDAKRFIALFDLVSFPFSQKMADLDAAFKICIQLNDPSRRESVQFLQLIKPVCEALASPDSPPVHH